MEEKREYKLRRLSRRSAYKGKILEFFRDTMELPSGKLEEWDFIKHPTGGACIVAVLPDGRILMERQFRPAVDREMLELPAGARDSLDEEPRTAAKRELEEETGYTCKEEDLTFLISLKSVPAWCDEDTEVFLARNLIRLPNRKLDEAEEIHLEAMEPTVLKEMIYRGEIQDAKTVAGILAYLCLENK